MTSMVERVAMAIQGKLDNEFAERGGLAAEEMADIAARAAIEAMSEPTEAMWNAVIGSPAKLRRSDWRDMIDAALNEKGQG